MRRRLSQIFGWLPFLKPARDRVDATVFAPPEVAAACTFMVQVFAHLPAESERAKALAQEFDSEAQRRGVMGLEIELERGERLAFHLAMPGLEVESPRDSLVWLGRTASVQFAVRVPAGLAPNTVVATLTASLSSVPVGHIEFRVSVVGASPRIEPARPVAAGVSARHYQQAFISYASADRREVLKRVQMLARLRIRFFQDIIDLDPGMRWERELYRRIDECDLFLLFWSNSARESEWVLREVRYALKRCGRDGLSSPEILPIVLEGPPPRPPDELRHLHFNDYLLYLMQQPRG